MEDTLKWTMYAAVLLSCIISFITGIVTANCTSKGKWGCARNSGAVLCVTSTMAVAIVGISVFSAKKLQ